MDCIPVAHSNEISKCLDPLTEVVGIDEAQFFDNGLVEECVKLVNLGKLVMLAGLDLDFKAEPFGPMPWLLTYAEEVEKLYAVCMVCGESAMRTQRLIDGEPPHRSDPLIVIGAAESYEARCKAHHIVLD
jgi:thymidine kinase